MYRKKGRGWTKHKDFMLLDVLCMQIAFIVRHRQPRRNLRTAALFTHEAFTISRNRRIWTG